MGISFIIRCWWINNLRNYSNECSSNISSVTKVLSKNYLRSNNIGILAASVQIVGNIASGTDEQTDV